MLKFFRFGAGFLSAALIVAVAVSAGAGLVKATVQMGTPPQPVSEEISRLIHRLDGPVLDADRLEQSELQELYDRRGNAPLWTEMSGRPSQDALNALARLRAASLDGLEPDDYGSAVLDRQAAIVAETPPPGGMAAFDVRLSLGVLRYFRHLHLGRIDPRELGMRLNVRADEHDFVEALRLALATHRINEAAEAFSPSLVQYRGLRDELARYRAMSSDLPLDASLARRVRQIELGLERLRWLPDLADDRLAVVNIPMFQLWGWDTPRGAGVPSFEMKVVVGRAMRTQTPVFVSEIRQVVFRPYWNVPGSIARAEILPAILNTPDYLARHDMEIVRGAGDDAPPVPATSENLHLLGAGRLRLRQRPGPANALGLIKFVLPNEENVYLHATPNTELFSRTRRDFSHGCVRVRDPEGLAEWLLDDPARWSGEQVRAATRGRTRTVDLTRPVPLILFYTTATFMPEEGKVQFAEDIYGHDARLEAALGRETEE